MCITEFTNNESGYIGLFRKLIMSKNSNDKNSENVALWKNIHSIVFNVSLLQWQNNSCT